MTANPGTESGKSLFETFETEAEGGATKIADPVQVVEVNPAGSIALQTDLQCTLAACDQELWAYGPNEEPLCELHYDTVERSPAVMAALGLGASLVSIHPSPPRPPETQTRTCPECPKPRVPGSPYCLDHMRGHLVYLLDRHRWPRLKIEDGQVVGPGNEAWANTLFTLSAQQLTGVLAQLERRQPALTEAPA